jgi:putative hydrolase of the HAD superfamily
LARLPYADVVTEPRFSAVLWDFGGVVISSPFEAFNIFEQDRGLPQNFIRSVNTHDPDSNAWARLERSEITPREFDDLFAAESQALGHRVQGSEVLALLHGRPRERMVRALDVVRDAGYVIACLTNNVATPTSSTDPHSDRPADVQQIFAKFHHVVESSKVGVRKPDTKFYEIACATIEIPPEHCVFLDDLGINLKPAAALGMHTIKVGDPDTALDELSELLSLPL